jgi:hypothetical protein
MYHKKEGVPPLRLSKSRIGPRSPVSIFKVVSSVVRNSMYIGSVESQSF